MDDLHRRFLILFGDYNRRKRTTTELILRLDKSKDVFPVLHPVNNRHYSHHINSVSLIAQCIVTSFAHRLLRLKVIKVSRTNRAVIRFVILYAVTLLAVCRFLWKIKTMMTSARGNWKGRLTLFTVTQIYVSRPAIIKAIIVKGINLTNVSIQTRESISIFLSTS